MFRIKNIYSWLINLIYQYSLFVFIKKVQKQVAFLYSKILHINLRLCGWGLLNAGQWRALESKSFNHCLKTLIFLEESHLFHTKSFVWHTEQYGFPPCSLNTPWLSCRRQNAHTKWSGWNLRSRAEMQRPEMGSPQVPHRVPCLEW